MTRHYPTLTALLFTVVLGTLVIQAFRRGSGPELIGARPVVEEECVGQPLFVDYPFQGGFIDPHACKVQCGDQIRRYIVYSNGQATQCEDLPGCLDWGEDRGITCRPPLATKTK